jgi:hypothetical protein
LRHCDDIAWSRRRCAWRNRRACLRRAITRRPRCAGGRRPLRFPMARFLIGA